MGSYLALFPKARIKIFVLLGGFAAPVKAPAWLFLLYWASFELVSLVVSGASVSNVAYAVHVGGFMSGLMGAVIWKVAYPHAEEDLSTFTSAAFRS